MHRKLNYVTISILKITRTFLKEQYYINFGSTENNSEKTIYYVYGLFSYNDLPENK